MATISDYHQYLFLGKITNSLSAEEDSELQELFARDSRAQDAYNELVRQLPVDQVAQSFGHLNAPGFWKNIAGGIRDEQKFVRRRKLTRAAGAAACIGLIAVGGWWVMTRSGSEGAAPSSNRTFVQAPHGPVELRLADGSTVDLNTEKGNIRKGQLAIDNRNNALSYQAADGAGAATNTLNVPVGMDYKITLSDGSEIWLNSASSLSFPSKFASARRELAITGEAYCKIARHVNQPMIIHLGDNTVEVTGTEFNVNTYSPGVVKVALVNGGVNVVAAASKLRVEPGFMAVAKGSVVVQTPFDPAKVLSWRQGTYIFEGADLSEITAVLARWFGVGTQLDDPSLGQKKFTGALYKDKPLSSFLDNLEVISHINAYVDEKNVLHFAAGR